MNLSPRRISASFSGRNRHITLMLHSAGSAISAGGREGAQGWVGGRGLAQRGKVVENRTARNKAASRSLDELLSRSSRTRLAGQLRPLRHLVVGSLLTFGPAGCRPAFPGPALRPRPTCPRPRGGRTRRCAGSQPLPTQTSRAPASSAILHQHQRARSPPRPAPSPRPAWAQPWSVTSLRGSAPPSLRLRERSILGLVVASPAGEKTWMLGVGFRG